MSALPSDARLNFRLAPDQKDLIEQAAAATGQTVSDFAISSMLRAAQDAIHAATTTRLSTRDRDTFLRTLSAPARPNAALKKAAARYKARRV